MLWGNFDDSWFLGDALGNYQHVFGYVEYTHAVHPEDIAERQWKMFDGQEAHYVSGAIDFICVDPHQVTTATEDDPDDIAEDTGTPDAGAPDGGCPYLFIDGYSSVYATGLLYSFGEYKYLRQMDGRPAYQHVNKEAYLYHDAGNTEIEGQPQQGLLLAACPPR